MRTIAVIAYQEWVQLFSRRSVIILLMSPLLLIFILGNALSSFFASGSTGPGSVRLALSLQDEGPMREALGAYLHSEQIGLSITELKAANREEIVAWVKKGEADIGLFVPAGFSRSMLEGMSPQWELFLGADIRKNVLTEQALTGFLERINHKLIVLKEGGRAFERSGEERIRPGLESAVRDGSLNPEWKRVTALQYYAVSMLFMFLLYSGMTSALSFVSAKEDHTLQRLSSMPIPSWQLVSGKVAGQLLICAFQALVIIVGTRLLFGVKWGSHPLLLAAVCFSFIVFSVSLAVILGTLFRTAKSVIAVFQPLTIIMTLISGGFTPEIGETLASMGPYTISFWGAQSVLRMMLETDMAEILRHLGILSLVAGVSAAAASLVCGKVGYRE